MLSIEMLPAREGDCLWIRYGAAAAPRQILIDAGRAATYQELKKRLNALPANARHFELLVITHVDRDHIEGVLKLLEDEHCPVRFKDIWFNGYDHLNDAVLDTLGAVQGERLTAALLRNHAPWNGAFKSKAIAIRRGKLPTVKLDGGLSLTVLSPDKEQLVALIPQWESECKAAGLIPGSSARRAALKGGIEALGLGEPNIEALAATPFVDDKALANGSSIALLLEHSGKRVLLGADAHVTRLATSIKTLLKRKKRLKIDVFKVPHHGSESNVSRELLQLLDCRRYLISTSGAYFKHPSRAAIARILKFGGAKKELYFNYDSTFTRLWNKPAWRRQYDYVVTLPVKPASGTMQVTL